MNLVNEIFQEKRPFFILGPCVIVSFELLKTVAEKVQKIHQTYRVPVIFKASFDKTNRTSINSSRGFAIEDGLKALENIKKTYGLPITTDIHESHQAALVAEVVDIIQIPAFLIFKEIPLLTYHSFHFPCQQLFSIYEKTNAHPQPKAAPIY